MAVKKKKINKPAIPEIVKPAIPPPVAPAPEAVKTRELPYALRRELEEITKNTGKVFDLNTDISVLEDICNGANQPQSAWRERWQ